MPHSLRPAEIFATLAERRVCYVVIGGLAAVLHGSPTVTVDADICADRSPETSSTCPTRSETCTLGFGRCRNRMVSRLAGCCPSGAYEGFESHERSWGTLTSFELLLPDTRSSLRTRSRSQLRARRSPSHHSITSYARRRSRTEGPRDPSSSLRLARWDRRISKEGRAVRERFEPLRSAARARSLRWTATWRESFLGRLGERLEHLLADDHAVPHLNLTVGVRGNIEIVGHHHDGRSVVVQSAEQAQEVDR